MLLMRIFENHYFNYVRSGMRKESTARTPELVYLPLLLVAMFAQGNACSFAPQLFSSHLV
jgi:hypothetical protein